MSLERNPVDDMPDEYYETEDNEDIKKVKKIIKKDPGILYRYEEKSWW